MSLVLFETWSSTLQGTNISHLGEKENHLQKRLGQGSVSSQEFYLRMGDEMFCPPKKSYLKKGAKNEKKKNKTPMEKWNYSPGTSTGDLIAGFVQPSISTNGGSHQSQSWAG